MFRLTNHHQGAYCCALLKLWLLKLSVKIRRYEFSAVVWLQAARILTDNFNKHSFSKAQQ